MLKEHQYDEFGYKGTADIKEGKRILILDWIGNLFGAFTKLILWNWKMERHWIREDTQGAIQEYLAVHQPELGNLKIQLNRYAPQDDWSRLVHNGGVKWPYRLFIGSFMVLIFDTILVSRIFGFDYYNPFTHTVHLYSDIPSVALHELGHAKDFSDRRYRGSYGLFRIIPGADLYQEYKATQHAFDFIREKQNIPREIEAYKILYPAYGTYMGGYLGFGYLIPVIGGHIWGRHEAGELKDKLEAAA